MTAPTPSPSPETDVDIADLEDEDDEAVEDEEEEEEQEEEIDEEEAEEEEEEEEMAVKDPEEYEYPIDSGPYQTSDYLDSFYYEKSQKPTTSSPLMKGDSCKCSSFMTRSAFIVPAAFFFFFAFAEQKLFISKHMWTHSPAGTCTHVTFMLYFFVVQLEMSV